MTLISKAACKRDVRQSLLLLAQQIIGCIDSERLQPLMRRDAHCLTEAARELIDRQTAFLCDFLERNGAVEVSAEQFLGAAHLLQSLKRQKLIENGRNKLVIRNRNGIERMAGAAYGTPEKEYRRLIG